jgi:Protein of unknown function (DUF1176)
MTAHFVPQKQQTPLTCRNGKGIFSELLRKAKLMKTRLPLVFALSLFVSLPALAEDPAPPATTEPETAVAAPDESVPVDWTARAKEAFLATYTEACAGDDDNKMEDRQPQIFEMKYREASDEADAPDRMITVYQFECTRGAYNLGQVFFVKNDMNEMQPLAFAEPDIHVSYENEDTEGKVLGVDVIGFNSSNILINSSVDAVKATITSAAKWRGVGDASSSGTWLLKSGRFVLSTYEVDASYDGEINPQMLLDYRVQNEKLSETP